MNQLTLLDLRLAAAGAVAVHVSRPDLKAMQLDRATTLWDDGLTRKAIAEAIGVPATTLHGWINKYRDYFPNRRGANAPPRERKAGCKGLDAAAKLWAEGLSMPDIARQVGVKAGTVNGWAQARRDLFPFRRPPAAEAEPVTPAERAPQALAPVKPARAEYVAGIDVPPCLRRPKIGAFTLMQLTATTCRWPMTDDMRDARFCGHRVSRGSYCAAHASLAYQPKGK